MVHSRLPALTLNIRVGDSLIHSPANLESVTEQLIMAADFALAARNIDLKESDRTIAVNNLEQTITDINTQINPVLTAFFASEESLQSAIKLIKNQEATQSELRAIRLYLITANSIPANWTGSELERLRSELMVISTAIEDVVIKRPFNWQVEFPHVFDPRLAALGFTAIIGNPPYFNVDATFGRGAPELLWLKTIYPDIYTDKTDILFYFLRWSYELLKSEGSLGFIVSRAFIQGDKSKNLRTFLSQNTKITSILDFLGHKVFKAGIATCIINFQKELPTAENIFTTNYVLDFDKVKPALAKKRANLSTLAGLVRVKVNQSILKTERWEISPYSHIFSEIDRKGQKLELSTYGSFMKGIDTGLDEIFEGDFSRRFPNEFLRPRVAISSIYGFGHKPSETQIIYYTRDTKWEEIPRKLQNYLQANRQPLENRQVFKSGGYAWFHIHRARVGLFQPKIFFPRMANSNKFAVDADGSVGFKSDVAGFVKSENTSIDRLYYICALLNSQVLEFRYRSLGGIGKLTGKGMFEYFENQVGDLPIPELSEEDADFQTLAELGKEAHQVWSDRYQIITTYQAKASSIQYQEVSASFYHNISGDYGTDVEYASPTPNLAGHLLSLRIEAKTDGYILWGEITEDQDWREGDREWVEIVTVKIRNPFLRRYLLARLTCLLEFDPEFRRKQKLNSGFSNLLLSAFDVLKLYRFDSERISNLRTLEVIEQRVQQDVGRSDLEELLLRQAEIQSQIDHIAYRIYGVEQYQEIMKQALKVIL